MNEQHILDFYALGSAFAGVVVIIAVAAALSRTSLSRVAFWLVAVAEVCLLLGAVTFNVFIWRAVVESTGTLWWEVVGLVLIAAGMVSGVVGLMALMQELALRRAIGWLALCAVALLVLVGANSALSGSTLLQIFDLPFLREMLRSRPKQHAYYGVVSALLVCALLPALAYFLRSGRPHGTAAAVARAGE